MERSTDAPVGAGLRLPTCQHEPLAWPCGASLGVPTATSAPTSSPLPWCNRGCRFAVSTSWPHGEERHAAAPHSSAASRKATVLMKGNARTKQLRGKMRETLGKALGDKSMQRTGRGEQLRGKAQEMTEKAAGQIRQRTKR
ncbi:CsbD family protein [Streptomyces sp. NPDC058086]|uniref:CsbD family protein n=1 Tax=Streptomyces sp. NPDC058086 TaxID=3346334 RepID=UPI0036EA786E